ncbi:MAG: replication endonuclease [Pseudomonadales bacterium]
MASRLEIPAPKGKTAEGRIARAKAPQYWSRRLSPVWYRTREQRNRVRGYVRNGKALYLSDPIYKLKQARDASNRVMLEEELVAISDHGDMEPVAALSDKTVSNPKIRRAELMTRISGMEDYATKHGHDSLFITLTLPGEWHVANKSDGSLVKNYNGSNPIEANAWFNDRWRQCRAGLNDAGLLYYGFRVIEPHHDGTPHWHLLVFVPAELRDAFKRSIEHYFGREHPNPAIGIKIVDGDPKKGSATAYIAKYVSKNIDGEALGVEERGHASRIVAWARIWGFRQFDQFGCPSVGVWRRLWSVRDEKKVPKSMLPAWIAVQAKDSCAYMEAMGGPCRGSGYPINVEKGIKEGINGERSPTENQYGEPLKTDGWNMLPVIGLRCGEDFLRTYAKFWTTALRTILSLATDTVRFDGPWTRDNNCRAGSGGFGFGQGPPPAQPLPMPALLQPNALTRESDMPWRNNPTIGRTVYSECGGL